MGDFIKDKAWKVVEGILQGFWETLIKPFEAIPTFFRLVYGGKEDNLVYNTFTPHDIVGVISPGIGNLTVLIGFILVFAMVRGATKLSSTGINPSNRTYVMEFARDWIFVILILGNLSLLYDILFTLNKGIIEFFKSNMELTNKDIYPPLEPGSIIAGIFARLVMLGVSIWAFFYYLMRKLTLMILMILGPIFISLFMFPSTRQVTISWFKELVGTIFVQAVHAVVLWITATIIEKGTGFTSIDKTDDIGILTMAMLFIIVIPLGEQLKGLLNLNTGMNDGLGKFAAMTGMAGMTNMANSIKGAMDGKSVGEVARTFMNRGAGGSNVRKDGEGVEEAAANVNPSAKRMFKASEMVSKGGKLIGGTTGAIAGMALGPYGSTIGSLAGFKLGGAVSPMARGAYAGAKGLKGIAVGGLKGAKDGLDNAMESEAMKNLIEQQADFDTKNWAANNKEDFIKALEEKGITGQKAEQAWNKKVKDQNKYFKNRAMDALSKHGIDAFDQSKARANELATEAANLLTSQYANSTHNKEAFANNLINQAQANGQEINDDMIEKSWNAHLGEKKQEFLANTRDLAGELTKGKGLDSFIDKGKFHDKMLGLNESFITGQENAFKDFYMKNNPNSSIEDANKAWDVQKGILTNGFNEGLSNRFNNLNLTPYGTGQQALGSAMAQQFAHDFKSMYGDEKGQFKEAFVQKLKQDNPAIKQVEVDRAWSEHVEAKYNDVLQGANAVAEQLSTNPNVDNVINKNDFADALKHSGVAKTFIDSQEAGFKNNFIKSNPGIDNQEVNAAWLNHKEQLEGNMGDVIGSSMSKVSNVIPAIASQAKAVDLVNSVTNDSMNRWLSQNSKEQFAQQLMSEPGNDNLSQAQIESAWNNRVADQKEYYNGQATQAAQQLTNGKPLDSFVDKGQFKQSVHAMRLEDSKEAFKQKYEGQATPEQIESAWDAQMPASSNEISNLLDSSISRVNPNSSIQGVINGTHARGMDLVEQATSDLTKNYISANRTGFYEDKLNQGMGMKEIDAAWNENVEGYQAQVSNLAMDTMKDLAGGQSQYAFIDKNQFANGLTSKRVDAARENLEEKLSGASLEFIDKQWERSGLESAIHNEGQRVIANVPQIQATKGYELSQYIASQRASDMTDQWAVANKDNFFEKQEAQGLSEPEIQNEWEKEINSQYGNNLSNVQQELANSSHKNVVIPRQIGAAIKGISAGGLQGMYEGSGMKAAIDVGRDGFNHHVLQKEPDIGTFKEAEQRQLQYQNTISFAAGVLGGEKAYQMAATSMRKNNPYSSYIQNSVMEVGDIADYAQKVMVEDNYGNMIETIGKDAIRMVVEPDRSFLQVKGDDGKYVRVSAFGAGSSDLQQGEVLYQDQAIIDNTLVPRAVQGSNSSFYKADSQGFKTIADYNIGTRASDLIANRQQVMNAEREVHFDTFSPEVDQGNFTLKDFQSNASSDVVTWVVEKNRSFMVMNTDNDKQVRITPYFEGNQSLPFGETLYKEVAVEGGRLRTFSKETPLNSYKIGDNGEHLSVDPELFPAIDLNNHLRPVPNKRLMRRVLSEQQRFKQGV